MTPMPSSPKPRFLAAGGRQGDGHGYANHPAFGMQGEPECVGPAILDGYAESARFYESLRHRQAVEAARLARPLLAVEDRIRDAQFRAKRAHIDLRSEFRLLTQMVERDRKGGRKVSVKVITRIERVEARLDGMPG